MHALAAAAHVQGRAQGVVVVAGAVMSWAKAGAAIRLTTAVAASSFARSMAISFFLFEDRHEGEGDPFQTSELPTQIRTP